MAADPTEHPRRAPASPRPLALLALAFVVCTAINVTKAVHVDDTAHLEIAAHIQSDPLHPMRGTVFWGEAPAPIHHLNQPHLFFYLLAGALGATGGSLIAAHLLVAVFTGLCALFAFRLGRALGLSEASAAFGATALLLGPAFIPSQNLMTDVPLLALWLAAFDAMARAGGRGGRYAWLAALYVGLACLMKYTSVVLLVVLAWNAWSRGRRRSLLTLSVPIALLAAWSVFNIHDYGGVHLLSRPVDSASVGGAFATFGVVIGRAALFVLTLGAVTPFSVAAMPETLARRGRRRVVAIIALWLVFALVVGQSLAAWGPVEMRGEPVLLSLLRGLFVLNGFYVLSLTWEAFATLRAEGQRGTATLVGSWALLTAIFVVVLSPFIAVRHVLLVLPAVLGLLLVSRVLPTSPRALALTALLGLLVAIGDYRIAAVYRTETPTLADVGAPFARAYYVGHWGFQHYANAAGLAAYVGGESELVACDRLIRPTIVDQQSITAEDLARLTLVSERKIEAGFLDLPRTITTRLGFYSVWHGVPYTFTLEPMETFRIYEVDAEECDQPPSAGGPP